MHQIEVATTRETLLDSPEMVLNMGPQHPSTHGVLRIILRLDGETVIDLDCDIGYLHRGMEKIAENRLYPMIAPYWDRLDYIAAVSNGLLWVETVEQMMGLDVPPRAHGPVQAPGQHQRRVVHDDRPARGHDDIDQAQPRRGLPRDSARLPRD